ncbi:uncharacterized protein MELLADRAFT_107283 [Melampsora larici-populina 98AG31]|uniref:Uncharacterized protein n=1 Tax=Melampsora larici-populina (strain 98AG31 / pathotype 3-4-7) TaxID=747676 RepID=F4RNT8_MELLP|nr:uncharacterized protein MELLADRAFT_107283 [Melampsora larici-populina 98AG31]EGG05802.1 hypothetical protein MELLADRAFT_107283 [Melampsora larici-populina 98AG31]
MLDFENNPAAKAGLLEIVGQDYHETYLAPEWASMNTVFYPKLTKRNLKRSEYIEVLRRQFSMITVMINSAPMSRIIMESWRTVGRAIAKEAKDLEDNIFINDTESALWVDLAGEESTTPPMSPTPNRTARPSKMAEEHLTTPAISPSPTSSPAQISHVESNNFIKQTKSALWLDLADEQSTTPPMSPNPKSTVILSKIADKHSTSAPISPSPTVSPAQNASHIINAFSNAPKEPIIIRLKRKMPDISELRGFTHGPPSKKTLPPKAVKLDEVNILIKSIKNLSSLLSSIPQAASDNRIFLDLKKRAKFETFTPYVGDLEVPSYQLRELDWIIPDSHINSLVRLGKWGLDAVLAHINWLRDQTFWNSESDGHLLKKLTLINKLLLSSAIRRPQNPPLFRMDDYLSDDDSNHTNSPYPKEIEEGPNTIQPTANMNHENLTSTTMPVKDHHSWPASPLPNLNIDDDTQSNEHNDTQNKDFEDSPLPQSNHHDDTQINDQDHNNDIKDSPFPQIDEPAETQKINHDETHNNDLNDFEDSPLPQSNNHDKTQINDHDQNNYFEDSPIPQNNKHAKTLKNHHDETQNNDLEESPLPQNDGHAETQNNHQDETHHNDLVVSPLPQNNEHAETQNNHHDETQNNELEVSPLPQNNEHAESQNNELEVSPLPQNHDLADTQNNNHDETQHNDFEQSPLPQNNNQNETQNHDLEVSILPDSNINDKTQTQNND